MAREKQKQTEEKQRGPKLPASVRVPIDAASLFVKAPGDLERTVMRPTVKGEGKA